MFSMSTVLVDVQYRTVNKAIKLFCFQKWYHGGHLTE